jgi:DNA-directed RNA polymerase specialized sigma24 family protein
MSGIGVGREFDTSFGEGLEIISQEVEKLSEMDRKIFELNLDNVPHMEIAELCGISCGNARKKWHDIRKRLLKNKYIFKQACELGLVG